MAGAHRSIRTVVHCGMPKTGTSSLQETLYQVLANKSFAYIHFDSGAPNVELQKIFNIDRALRKARNSEQSRSEVEAEQVYLKKSLSKQLSRNPSQTKIIVCEAIQSFKGPGLKKFNSLLQKYSESVQYIYYVRSPYSYFSSAFQQRMKRDKLFDIENLMRSPEYEHNVKEFQKAFGEDNLTVRLFDPELFPDGNSVLDFCRFAEIDVKKEDCIRRNESLSYQATALLYIFRKYSGLELRTRSTLRYMNTLVPLLRSLGGESFLLDKALIDQFFDPSTSFCQKLNEKFNGRFLNWDPSPNKRIIHSFDQFEEVSVEAKEWLAQRLGIAPSSFSGSEAIAGYLKDLIIQERGASAKTDE